jgi:hypothetical protein
MAKIKSMPEPEHAALVGRVSIAWNDVQFEIFKLFAAVSGMPEVRAEAVFFALRNDRSQRDITLAAALNALLDNGDLFSRCEAAINDAGKLSGERNAVMHAMWATKYPEGHITPSPFVRGPSKLRKDDFERQFTELTETLRNLFRRILRLRIEVEKHLASQDKAPERT